MVCCRKLQETRTSCEGVLDACLRTDAADPVVRSVVAAPVSPVIPCSRQHAESCREPLDVPVAPCSRAAVCEVFLG